MPRLMSVEQEHPVDSDLVAVAKVVKPHGIRGNVTAEILTGFPERFENLIDVIAVAAEGDRSKLVIADHSFHKNRLILKFDGIDSIEEAENLRNATICVPESEAVELEADEYFDWDLEGCRVVTIDGTHLGEVREISRAGENENLVVKGPDAEYLIPFARAICTTVDIGNKLIEVDPPEGLLDF